MKLSRKNCCKSIQDQLCLKAQNGLYDVPFPCLPYEPPGVYTLAKNVANNPKCNTFNDLNILNSYFNNDPIPDKVINIYGGEYVDAESTGLGSITVNVNGNTTITAKDISKWTFNAILVVISIKKRVELRIDEINTIASNADIHVEDKGSIKGYKNLCTKLSHKVADIEDEQKGIAANENLGYKVEGSKDSKICEINIDTSDSGNNNFSLDLQNIESEISFDRLYYMSDNGNMFYIKLEDAVISTSQDQSFDKLELVRSSIKGNNNTITANHLILTKVEQKFDGSTYYNALKSLILEKCRFIQELEVANPGIIVGEPGISAYASVSGCTFNNKDNSHANINFCGNHNDPIAFAGNDAVAIGAASIFDTTCATQLGEYITSLTGNIVRNGTFLLQNASQTSSSSANNSRFGSASLYSNGSISTANLA